jgi:crossover junction endodeoxyribonuclease RuvC
MIIIAIDPGYDRLGVAILDCSFGVGKEEVVFSDCIETNPKDPFPKRLAVIYESVVEVIENFNPKVLAIENLYMATNKKTAMRVAESRGVVVLAAERAGLEIFEYSPPQVKVAVTGHGGSTKDQVERMVKKLTSYEKTSAKDDELDAIAVGLTHNAMASQRYH